MLLSLVYVVVRVPLRGCWSHRDRAKPPRISKLSCSGTNSMCLGARSSGLAFDLPIGHFWPPRPDVCHGLAGSVPRDAEDAAAVVPGTRPLGNKAPSGPVTPAQRLQLRRRPTERGRTTWADGVKRETGVGCPSGLPSSG